MWEYIGVAAGAGALWSALQFLNKIIDKERAERWKDWDWLVFGRTVLFNAIGAGIGLLAAIHVIGTTPDWPLAVGAGLFGEKGIDFAVGVYGRIFPPKK